MFKIGIQDVGIPMVYTEAMINACEELKYPYFTFGLIENSDRITNVLDSDLPVIPFGSVKLLRLYYAGKLPKSWIVMHNHLFDLSFISNLKMGIFNQRLGTFLLSGNAKTVAGNSNQVFSTADTQISNHLKFAGDVLVSDVIDDITSAWRIFVVNGKVIDACQYAPKLASISFPERQILKILALYFQPATAYVVDLCRRGKGLNSKYYIVEYNAIQCSSLYNCNPKLILKSIINTVNVS